MTITEQELAEIRDNYFEPKGEWAESRIDRVLNAAQVHAGDRVLDLGCSIGAFSFHTRRLGANTIGLDRDAASLGTGREAAWILAKIQLTPVCGDALNLPFADNTFNIVINSDFIEHTPDDAKDPIFREMFRVLKPGGHGILYTPNLARIQWELLGEKIKYKLGLRHEKVPRWQEFVDPDHFGLTTPEKTRLRLRSAGFETRMMYYEYHIPLLSKVPGIGKVFDGVLPDEFAARFLIQIRKPYEP
jgi:SAM-dependent methyltransferase